MLLIIYEFENFLKLNYITEISKKINIVYTFTYIHTYK